MHELTCGELCDIDHTLTRADEYWPNMVIEVEGTLWAVPCGQIFCLTCDQCMAESEPECISGAAHDWPDGWRDLAQEIE